MEEVLENETLKEKWGEIEQLRVNELAEEKARLKQAAEPEETPEDPDAGTALVQMRKAPSSFTEDSEAYWLAVANETVRRFVTSWDEAPSRPSNVCRLLVMRPRYHATQTYMYVRVRALFSLNASNVFRV